MNYTLAALGKGLRVSYARLHCKQGHTVHHSGDEVRT